jgi:hypothetical protein
VDLVLSHYKYKKNNSSVWQGFWILYAFYAGTRAGAASLKRAPELRKNDAAAY